MFGPPMPLSMQLSRVSRDACQPVFSPLLTVRREKSSSVCKWLLDLAPQVSIVDEVDTLYALSQEASKILISLVYLSASKDDDPATHTLAVPGCLVRDTACSRVLY